MARKKPARSAKKAKKQAKKKSARRASARKIARKSASRSTRKAAKKSSSKRAAKRAAKPARKPASAKAPARQAKPKKKSMLASAVGAVVGTAIAAGVRATMSGKKPNLDRPRKTVADVHGIPSSLGGGGGASAAQSGRAELRERLRKNTSASPALTSGDVDADWESAETIGDEAPGGDNPTPDQDVVDDIGRALGVEYEDDEELQGGAEIKERDRRRWELDPASKDRDEDDE